MRRGIAWSVWGWPLGLALVTLFALAAALLGQGGIWLWLAWAGLVFLLGVPLLFVAAALRRDGADRLP